MLVRILGFGINWWARFGRDPEDCYRYTKRTAYYNSTGVRCGNKIRRHWIVPGLIRFNGASDFNPHFPMRSIGCTFSCTEPVFAFGGNRIVFQKRVSGTIEPDFFLVVVSSERFGLFDFESPACKCETTRVIAASHLRNRQEAMLLMKPGGWISSNLGHCRLTSTNQVAARALLQLDDGCTES